MGTIADDTGGRMRPVHLLSPFFGMLAALSGGASAHARQSTVFLLACAVLALLAVGVQVHMLVQLRRQRRHDDRSAE